MLGEWDLHVILVLVLDGDQRPRIAALYITNGTDKKALFDKLTSV